MPGRDQSISAAMCRVFAVPPDGAGRPIPIGIVEDFSATDNFASELLQSIGEGAPTDGVVNNMQGAYRWGRVHKLNRTVLRVIRPELARFVQYVAFDILIADPNDGVAIARLVACLPQSLDCNVTNGRAMRENYSGVCRYVQRGEEITEAAA